MPGSRLNTLVVSTMKAALLGTTEQAAAAGAVSVQAAALAKGAVHAMWLSKLQTTVTALVLSVALIGGGGLFTYRALAVGPGDGSSNVTAGDEAGKQKNGTVKADEADKNRQEADKAEIKRLRDLAEVAALREQKLRRENDMLKKRLKDLEDKVSGARPTTSSSAPAVKPSNRPGQEKPSSDSASIAATAVDQDASDAVEIAKAQLQVKKAELKGATVEMQSAQRNVARVTNLAKSKVISSDEIQSAQDKLAGQKAAVQAKEAEVQEQEVRLRQAIRRRDQPRSGTTTLELPAPAGSNQQELQEIRKALKELERRIDRLDKSPRPARPRQ